MPSIWNRIGNKVRGRRDEPARLTQETRPHGGDEMVDGSPRSDASAAGVAPPDVADENEMNVGGAPRGHDHEPGHVPAMQADDHEALVDGAPRTSSDAPFERTVDGAPRFGDEGEAGEDFRTHPQA